MVYMKSFSLLAACMVGFFGNHKRTDSVCVASKDGRTFSVVHEASKYLIGPDIVDASVSFVEDENPITLSNFVDRLKCRVYGRVFRSGVDKKGDEFFYACSHRKDDPSTVHVSNEGERALQKIYRFFPEITDNEKLVRKSSSNDRVSIG